MNLDLVAQTLTELGEPSYRLDQVWKWAAEGASSYEEMTNLPKRLRDALTDGTAVDRDGVGLIDVTGGVIDDLAINAHASVADDLLGRAP